MSFISRFLIVDRTEFTYQIYVPDELDNATKLPLILALHGGGERGRDGQRQILVGLGHTLQQHADRYPAIVIFPQVPEDENWQGLGSRIALAALDQTISEFNVDLMRVYLTGLSMGGNGVWYLAYHYPERFAALVVVCGWVSERQGRSGVGFPAIGTFDAVAQRLKGIPAWIFHGADDAVVPVEEARQMMAALQQVGGMVQYTEFPGVGHRAWDQAYEMQALSTWLSQQSKEL